MNFLQKRPGLNKFGVIIYLKTVLMSNPIGWVEVPVTDMARAIDFYNKIFGWNLQSQTIGDLVMAMFPSNPTSSGSSGALVYKPKVYEPSETAGPLIYFSCGDCGEMDEKTERAGGRIVVPKQPIPGGYGYSSVCIDIEGNRIGFHSMQ